MILGSRLFQARQAYETRCDDQPVSGILLFATCRADRLYARRCLPSRAARSSQHAPLACAGRQSVSLSMVRGQQRDDAGDILMCTP